MSGPLHRKAVRLRLTSPETASTNRDDCAKGQSAWYPRADPRSQKILGLPDPRRPDQPAGKTRSSKLGVTLPHTGNPYPLLLNRMTVADRA